MGQPKYVIFDFAFTLCSQKYFHRLGTALEEKIDRILFADNQAHWADRWMAGQIDTDRVVAHLSDQLQLPAGQIHAALEQSCRSLRWNPAVWRFALDQKRRGRRLALVTINMDVFSRLVVPFHRLDETFDVILNSADQGHLDKLAMWRKAFELLGDDADFSNSLLVDDSIHHLTRFRLNGGRAVIYLDDEHFRRELIQHGLAPREGQS